MFPTKKTPLVPFIELVHELTCVPVKDLADLAYAIFHLPHLSTG